MNVRVRTLCAVVVFIFVGLAVVPPPAVRADDGVITKIVQVPLDVIWHDPGDVSTLNLAEGSGGADGEPAPPFQFLSEDMSGSNPKVMVKDAHDRKWDLKWGEEAKPEVLATRIAWACGYFTEVEYFVAQGQINGAHGLKRASHQVDKQGNFTNARFQLRSDWPKFLQHNNWEWDHNPFVASRELNGLRVLMMFVSNWDNKDARDAFRDSNLGVFETNGDPHQYEYLVADWGASFGRWGPVVTRGKWDCKGYAVQTPSFVTGVSGDTVHFGYVGQHSDLAKSDIRVSDVAWLLQYLGKISDDQFRQALVSGGANPAECDCYGHALRQRVGELRAVAAGQKYRAPANAAPAQQQAPAPNHLDYPVPNSGAPSSQPN